MGVGIVNDGRTVRHGDPAVSSSIRASRARLPGIALASLSSLPVAAIVLIAQVLPQIEQHYAGTPHLRLQSSIALTIPSLMVGLTSWMSGWFVDRNDKRRVLFLSLALYGLLGLMPLFLDDLHLIILSRAGLGIVEGLVMISSTALICELYDDGRRESLLSLQTSIAAMGAIVFSILGGFLGEFGWRTPFFVYSIAFAFIPLILLLLGRTSTGVAISTLEAKASGPMPWRSLAGICGGTMVFAMSMSILLIQLPFLLKGIGTTSPTRIGLAGAVSSVATVAGTVCFVRWGGGRQRWTFPVIFGLLGLGLAVLASSTAPGPFYLGLVIASVGSGIGLPTFLNAAMAIVPPTHRGMGVGLWMASFWSAHSLSPVLLVPLTAATGSLTSAVILFAGLCAIFSAAAFQRALRRPSPRKGVALA